MKGYQFEDTQGTFHLKKAENISYLYFPIAGEAGLKSSLTPNLGEDRSEYIFTGAGKCRKSCQ